MTESMLSSTTEKIILLAPGWVYVYDGNGLRVRKCTPNENNRNSVLDQLTKLSQDCLDLLSKLGFDLGQLQNAVKAQIPWDGVKSTISQGDAGVWDDGVRPDGCSLGCGVRDTDQARV